MKYSDALRLVGGVRSKVHESKINLYCNATPEPLATFLLAYAIEREMLANIIACPYGMLQQSLSNQPSPGTVGGIVIVSVDDIFPELSLRSTAPWTASIVENLLEGAALRIKNYSQWLASRLQTFPGTTVVVPPLVLPPPLQAAGHHSLCKLRCLNYRILLSLVDEIDHPGTTVLDPLEVVSGLDTAELVVDSNVFQFGGALSNALANRVAEACVAALAPLPRPRKLLVTDLDGVLWSGIIGEDGPQGVDAAFEGPNGKHTAYARMLGLLRSEGIALAVVSKNNPSDAEVFLRDRPMLDAAGVVLSADDFVRISCQWIPKSEQISELCHSLNLPPSAVVFVDDNPLELAEVGAALPDVHCMQFPTTSSISGFLQQLRSAFPVLALTAEDRERTEFYRRREAAEQHRQSFGSVEDYLRSLEQTARFNILMDTDDDRRLFQLFNKTNQFNLTGVRYDEATWKELRNNARTHLFQATLKDRFGSHGIVLGGILRREGAKLSIENIAMSCRVFGRGLEYALADWLGNQFISCDEITARRVPTPHNAPTENYLETIGFSVTSEPEIYWANGLVAPSHTINIEAS